MEYLTPAGLTTLFLELLKWIIRNWFLKDPLYDFPAKFYLIAVPVFNVLMTLPLALLLPEQFPIPTDWVLFLRLVALTLVNSLISVFLYNTGIKPTKLAFREKAK